MAVAAALLGCRRDVDAKDVETQLQQHPEILYRVIEQHPVEVITALNKAAQFAQAELQKSASRDADARMEAEFTNPKLPALDGRIVFGNEKAPVTIVEYSDFECPYCRRERDVLVAVMQHYGDRVRLILKHAPLTIHAHSMVTALAYEAVAHRDPAKAIKLYDELFNNQNVLELRGESYLFEAVQRVGADVATVKADMKADAARKIVDADLAEFQKFGFQGTPAFVVNGVTLEGAQPQVAFERVIDRHLAAGADGRKLLKTVPDP